MPRKPKPPEDRPSRRLVSYHYPDEVEAAEERAKSERVSLSELVRRALRAYLGLKS